MTQTTQTQTPHATHDSDHTQTQARPEKEEEDTIDRGRGQTLSWVKFEIYIYPHFFLSTLASTGSLKKQKRPSQNR